MTNRNKTISVICFLLIVCLLSFQTSYAEILCVPAFIKEDERKLDPLKNTLFSGNKTFSETKGVESYNEALVRELKSLLGRKPGSMQIEAIEKANLAGKDKNEIARIREKTKILKEAGFSREEIRLLMENGIVWIKQQDPIELLIKNLQKGDIEEKKLYFIRKPLFSNTSDRHAIGRINKILEETNDGFLVEADLLDPSSNTVKRHNISINKELDSSLYQQLPSNFKVLFEAARSQREIITLEDLNLPSPTNKEAELAKQGFNSAFTKGLDDLSEWAAVRRRLEELKANPYTTHIKYFANQIQDHIKHIEIAISSSANTTRLIYLKKLAEEARQAITDKKVTYKWWIEFNEKLSSTISIQPNELPKERKLELGEDIEFVIAHFPLIMMVPTIKGSLGYITFNRARSEGIYPLGLINKSIKADGEPMPPIVFIRHDRNHAAAQLKLDRLFFTGHKLFDKKLQKSMDDLPAEKRKQAELVYFQMTHEMNLYKPLPDISNDIMKNHTHTAVYAIVHNHLTAGSYSSAFKLFGAVDKQDFINSYIEAFMEVYSKAQSY